MYFLNYEIFSLLPSDYNTICLILLIISTFVIGVWLLYISTKDYNKETAKLVEDVITMRKQIADISGEIGTITQHCCEQYNIMDNRLKDVQDEIEHRLQDIEHVERYIMEKTNSNKSKTATVIPLGILSTSNKDDTHPHSM